jgi:hypothetical protein
MAMSEADDIETVQRARIVADALVEGDVDAMVELAGILEAAGTGEQTKWFVLQLIFELLPAKAQEWMAAKAEEAGHSNVIDLFTRKPRP